MSGAAAGLSWDLTAHVRGALAEALVAEAVFQTHPDAVLHSPRHPGFDVSSDKGGWRVDAKVAEIYNADLDASGQVASVQWDGGGRADPLHETATHLGLVVLDDAVTSLKLRSGQRTVLRGELDVQGRVFLIPSEVVRATTRPLWSPRLGRATNGRFRYLPLAEAQRYEVEFRFNV